MLHAKFQNHRPSGSGEDFLRFLLFIAMAAILVMWPGPFIQTLFPPSHEIWIWLAKWFQRRCLKSVNNDNLNLIGHAVSEKMYEKCEQRRQRWWTTEHGYTISSPCEPNGSGELKTLPYILTKKINICAYTMFSFINNNASEQKSQR